MFPRGLRNVPATVRYRRLPHRGRRGGVDHLGLSALAEEGHVDVLQPDLSRCGGLTVARRVAHLADDLNLQVCAHAWGSPLLTAASVHYAAFVRGETFLEFNTSNDPLSRGLVVAPLAMEDGYVEVPQRPGLGVEPDLDEIDRFRVR